LPLGGCCLDRTDRIDRASSTVGGPRGARTARPDRPAVVEVFGTEAALHRHPELAAQANRLAVPVSPVTDKAVAALTDTVHPQGLVAVCTLLDVPLEVAVARAPRLVAVLADIRDPGNAGTVLRAADAAGADAVVFAGDAVDPYNGKCVRASAGSLFHLAVVRGVAPGEAAAALREVGLRLLAADGAGERDLDELADSGALGGPTGWILGNEAWGLPRQVADLADARVRIPIYGAAESLNLAAAAAVCLYASARAQRRVNRPHDVRGRLPAERGR
jgi:TrmH family RNA methyltransferase